MSVMIRTVVDESPKQIFGVRLPPVRPTRRDLPQQYGVLDVCARYCRLRPVPKGGIPGLWSHGWIEAERQCAAEVFFGHPVTISRDASLWVARKDEERWLHQHGYPSARAIGLPIVYVRDRPVRRAAGSLLVMPVHSLDYTSHNWRFEDYVDQIDSIRQDFSDVAVCVHRSCWRKGYWVDAFRDRGFTVVCGADEQDRNALWRMARMLSASEYMTTNCIGSHVAYAAAFGCKPSIFGSYAEYSRGDFANDPFYRRHPDLLTLTLEVSCEQAVQKRYPFLFGHPREAKRLEGWGREQIGANNRVSPDEMIRLFGWTPVKRARDELQFRRDELRYRYRVLMRTGAHHTPELIKAPLRPILRWCGVL